MAAGLLKSFTKNIAAIATPEALSATTLLVTECVIRAKVANVGIVYIGDSAAQEYPAQPGEPFRIAQLTYTRISPRKNDPFIDLKDIYIRVESNGDGVHVAYIDRSGS
jgi:hypothetical protein